MVTHNGKPHVRLKERVKPADGTDPTVTLAARFNKSKRVKVQPVPVDVSAVLRDYLAGKDVGAPVWPGTWREKAADMLRGDLEAVKIACAVEGPDGPESPTSTRCGIRT